MASRRRIARSTGQADGRSRVEDTARREEPADEGANPDLASALFAAVEPARPALADPYAALGVDPLASWEQIAAAHRRLVKLHHPDRLTSLPPSERVLGEERIRALNVAYTELRRRHGR